MDPQKRNLRHRCLRQLAHAVPQETQVKLGKHVKKRLVTSGSCGYSRIPIECVAHSDFHVVERVSTLDSLYARSPENVIIPPATSTRLALKDQHSPYSTHVDRDNFLILLVSASRQVLRLKCAREISIQKNLESQMSSS